MSGHDLSFRLDHLDAFHVAVDGAGYWESGAAAPGRFEFRPGWRTVYATRVESPMVRVRLAHGTVGWGESTTPVGPEVVCLIAEALLLPMARGREFGHPQELRDFLYDAQRGRGQLSGYYLEAAAAIDIAVWDALGHRHGLPVAALLAEAPRRAIPLYLSGVRRPTLEERVAHLRRLCGEGLAGAKVFVTGDPEAALAELDALQRGVPNLRRWMLDTLWMLTPETAPAMKAALAERGAEWLECPLPPEDLPAHRALAARPGAPIALGEHFHTLYESGPWFEAGALNVFQPDVGRTGLSDGVRQQHAAAAAGIPTTPHMGSAFDVFQAATLHFSATCGDSLLCEYQAGLAGRLPGAVTTSWTPRAGQFQLPERPGLGVAVDVEALSRFVVAR